MASYRPDYEAGTVSVAAGGTVVTGAGGMLWNGISLQPGDLFGSQGYPMSRVVSITDNTHIVIEPWRGAALPAGSQYFLRFQADGSRYAAILGQVRTMLGQDNIPAFAGLTAATDTIAYFTGPATMATVAFKAKGRDIAAAADSATAYAALGQIPNAQLPTRLQSQSQLVANLNTITETGWYRHAPGATGQPISAYGLLEHNQFDANSAVQNWYQAGTQLRYTRAFSGGAWGSWTEIGVAPMSALAKTLLANTTTAQMFSTMGGSSGSRWMKLPGGLIIQWGFETTTATDFAITFPIAFPTAVGSVVGSMSTNAPANTAYIVNVSASISLTGCSFMKRYVQPGVVGQAPEPMLWIAIGS